MKKIIMICLATLCISTSLIGCSSDSNSTSSVSTSKSSTKSSGTCQFKDSNGNRTCTNTATHGQLCDTHFNMLNDTYNSLIGD